MTTNFLYQLNQHFPHSYAITLSAAKFELGLLSQISQTLASLQPAIRLLHQDTLVNELDWQANDTLTQADAVLAISGILVQCSPFNSTQQYSIFWLIRSCIAEFLGVGGCLVTDF